MLGLIQKIVIEMLEEKIGVEETQQLKVRAGLPSDRVFRINQAYCDEEWQRLLAEVCNTLNVTQDQALDVYTEYFFKDAMARWPIWFQISKSAKEFLVKQIDIHNQFASSAQQEEERKKVRDKFSLVEEDNRIITYYRSPNRLCSLYKMLATWIMNYYGDVAEITEITCQKNGDEQCEIHMNWPKE